MMLTSVIKAGQFYGYAVIQLLIEPGLFFKELPKMATPARTAGFMIICALFFTAASLLTGAYDGPVWIMAGIYFVNVCAMILISSCLGYMTMIIIAGRQVSFSVILSIYTFSTGLTLFLSWLPFFLWFTEPWKWWLIFTGFKNSCRLDWKRSVLISAVSVMVQFFLIYSALVAFVK